jgi:hypothetical protein
VARAVDPEVALYYKLAIARRADGTRFLDEVGRKMTQIAHDTDAVGCQHEAAAGSSNHAVVGTSVACGDDRCHISREL